MNMQGIKFAAIIFSSSLLVCLVPKIMTSLRVVKKLFPFLTLTTAGFLLGVQLLDLSPHMLFSCKGHSHDTKHDHEHDHGHHKHDHHSHHDSGLSENSPMLGFFVAGLSFIFLLGIDTIILKHKHCDEEQEKEKHLHEEEHHHHEEPKYQVKTNKGDGLSITTTSIPVVIQKVEDPKKPSERLGCCDTSAIKNTSSKTQVFIYILGISIHSFFEGLVFKSDGKIGSLEIGLIFHKILESFALGVPLFTSGFQFSSGLALATFYSSLTPIGIIIGGSEVNHKIKSIFNGLALGSIMFMVSFEMIPPMFNHSKGAPLYKILTLFLGYLLSAVVIYYSHAH